LSFRVVTLCLQNAGAVIGKGGSNIKRLRQDVSNCCCIFCIISKPRIYYHSVI